MVFIAFLRKEWLVLSRDYHALLLLFLMPALFILIMSLAMEDNFQLHGSQQIEFLLIDRDASEASSSLRQRLSEMPGFVPVWREAEQLDSAGLLTEDYQFIVIIPEGYEQAFVLGEAMPLTLQIAPSTQKPLVYLFDALLKEQSARIWMSLQSLSLEDAGMSLPEQWTQMQGWSDKQAQLIPSAVQQSVPAWMIFAMFFIAVPISNAFLTERQQNTLARLASMNVSVLTLILGKFVPYMLINWFQAVIMVAIGCWLVPLLGGDALNIHGSISALAVITIAVSIAAVGFALLIASLVDTTEQATILAAVSNIILAALAGVMVPKFLMPEYMQQLAVISPHAWALDAYLDIFLFGQGLAAVWQESIMLILFGLTATLLALLVLKRRHVF